MGFFENIWEEMIKHFTNVKIWETLLNHAASIIFILIGTFVAVKVGRAALHRTFRGRQGNRLRMTEKRETTLEQLVENAFSYVIYFIALLMILSNLGTDIKGLVAGAGIAGLALGFGAQSFVKDVITGFFIVFEDQFSIGDYVKVGSFTGTVEQIGLRTTKIQNWTGELHILPNSSITEVTNYSVYNSIAVVDISIAYEEDVNHAQQVIEDVVSEMASQHPEIVRPPEVLGVQTLGSSDVVIRIVTEVLPMEHWRISREIRKAVKIRFDEIGIEIPYPRLVTYRRSELDQVEENMRKDEG